MAGRRPVRRLRRPLLAGAGWARVPVAKRRGALRDTDEGERFDDYAIRRDWRTGEALPDATVVRRELAGAPTLEVVGSSKAKVEILFWDTITQVRADLAGVSGNDLHSSRAANGNKWVWRLDIAAPVSHDRCMDHAPWNGSATTS